MLRESGVKIHPETAVIGDAAYQGFWRAHGHTLIPTKATKCHPLTPDERQDSRVLAHFRQPIEHVIRRLNIFRVLKETYRHRRRRFALRAHLIAALVNHTLTLQS